MYEFAFKNLWVRKARTALAIIGLAIAVTGVITLVSISNGMKHNIESILSGMEGVIVLEKGAVDDAFSTIDESLVDKISRLKYVKTAVPMINGIASNIEEQGESLKAGSMLGLVLFLGVDPQKQALLEEGSFYNPKITEGRRLMPGDKYSVVIGQQVADDYDKNVGSIITFNGKKFKVVGLFSTGSKIADRMMIIPIKTAREITGKEEGKVSMIYVEPKNPSQTEALRNTIELMFDDVSAKSSSSYSESTNQILNTLSLFFITVSSIALMVGGIGILNTMLMSVSERTKEFGILKAIGWSKDDVLKLVMYESLCLGVIGGFTGIGFSFLLIALISPFLPFSFIVTPELLVMAFFISVLLSVIGGIYPAFKAASLDPVTAIRYE